MRNLKDKSDSKIIRQIAGIRKRLKDIDHLLARLDRDLTAKKSKFTKPVSCDGKTMGERIRLARERVGMSQRDLAARSGVSNPQLCKIERDYGDVCTQTALKISDAIGVDVAWLIRGSK